MRTDAEISFVEQVCLPFLRSAQNPDGGWGFHPRSQSRVESTCWAVGSLSVMARVGVATDAENIGRGLRFLRATQLPDGSWPAAHGETTGSWVTSLACCVLRVDPGATPAAASGLRWLCNDWPRDSSPWRRFLARFSSQHEIFPINNAYRGWGWTPETSSWVEPTSFALLALEQANDGLPPWIVKRRRALAASLLYDRMCPGGGWNCGNPSVYGVAGEPLVVPTAFALLALRADPQRRENVAGLDWLVHSTTNIQAAGSLAVARICLSAYGREWPAQAARFADLYANGEFLESVQVTAWTCMALSGQDWLARAAVVGNRS